MNRKPLAMALLIALVMTLLNACASSTQKSTLDATLLQYESVIRWSQWDGAIDFLAPKYLEENPVSQLDIDRLRLFRVTQYTVRSVMPTADGMTIRQAVEIRLFNRNRAVEQALLDQQEWRYNPEHERWYLWSGLPDVTRSR
ncbi:MAG: hypothetical protein KJO85_02825 [Gammaproteobacteria bacterium]|nr:hypothetical protein [Gammaproteobacteria bacterium]NNE06273.1 hypothetical protein [Xanthomonadales bacterium]